MTVDGIPHADIYSDRWTVGKWVDGWSQKEIDEMLTDLINGDYTVIQLRQDFQEWMQDNIDVGE